MGRVKFRYLRKFWKSERVEIGEKRTRLKEGIRGLGNTPMGAKNRTDIYEYSGVILHCSHLESLD